MDRKWTYLMFAAGGLLLFYILAKSGLWGWDFLATTDFAGDFVGKPREWAIDALALLIAGGATVVALKNEELFTMAGEVTSELRKVTWPTREELKGSTITVIIFSLMSTAFVFLVDFVLGKLVQLVLG